MCYTRPCLLYGALLNNEHTSAVSLVKKLTAVKVGHFLWHHSGLITPALHHQAREFKHELLINYHLNVSIRLFLCCIVRYQLQKWKSTESSVSRCHLDNAFAFTITTIQLALVLQQVHSGFYAKSGPWIDVLLIQTQHCFFLPS